MALYKLQVSLPDRPGSLGMLASAIGSAGADIRELQVLKTVDGIGFDEITVAVPGTNTDDLVEILNSIGGVNVISIVAL
ncbi:unannotated protein [freshwater metagenome]|uniref:Unannotated protein n=1 Tax=freshwater metagenome TaxID=449393 RepID=A0A6J6AVE5_9ZZZZ|nr:hypothetical protein [Actinomycetota bacterium]